MLMSLVHTFVGSQGRGSLLIPIPWNPRRRREATLLERSGGVRDDAAAKGAESDKS